MRRPPRRQGPKPYHSLSQMRFTKPRSSLGGLSYYGPQCACVDWLSSPMGQIARGGHGVCVHLRAHRSPTSCNIHFHVQCQDTSSPSTLKCTEHNRSSHSDHHSGNSCSRALHMWRCGIATRTSSYSTRVMPEACFAHRAKLMPLPDLLGPRGEGEPAQGRKEGMAGMYGINASWGTHRCQSHPVQQQPRSMGLVASLVSFAFPIHPSLCICMQQGFHMQIAA